MTPEEELLGCILAGADPADVRIRPAEFEQPRDEAIFRACLEVSASGRRCDPQTVVAELGPLAQRLPAGAVHLVNLAEHAVPHNAAAFADQVRAGAERRRLAEVAAKIRAHLDAGVEPEDIREEVRANLDQSTSATLESVRFGDLLPGFIDRVEKGDAPGMSTPWEDLDRHLHGLHPGRLYTVGGRPGSGKSVILANLAAHFAGRHEVGVFFATLEMPAPELVGRIVAAQSRVAQVNLLTGSMSEMDWQRIQRSYDRLSALPLRICDDPGQTLQSLRTAGRDMAHHEGLGLLVVDYLQLMTPPDRRLSRQQQIGDLTRGLKRLAKELGVPVATASQLRRPQDGKGSRPTMSDLRESGDIEADSDVVLLLHNPDEDKPWDLEVMVAKNRSGSRGPVELMFDTTRASIQNADPHLPRSA